MEALFVTPNPSVAYTYALPSFVLGERNRSKGPVIWANGKATISARAFARLGGMAELVFFSGGRPGQEFEDMLSRAERLTPHPVRIDDSMRRTYSFLDLSIDPPQETHLLELGPEVTRKEVKDFMERTCEAAKRFENTCIGGSLPPGFTPSDLRTIVAEIQRDGDCRVLLDTSGDALKESVKAAPHCVKISLSEFEDVFSASRQGDSLPNRIRQVAKDYRIQEFVVTRQHKEIIAVERGDTTLSIVVPKVTVVNSVGCGDCFNAGMIMVKGSFRFRLRCAAMVASANAETLVPGEFATSELDRVLADAREGRRGG